VLNLIKSSILFGCVAGLCSAQTIHISGLVLDSAGEGIQGATVRLETAGLTTTSGADGSFTLAGEPQSVIGGMAALALDNTPPVLRNGRLHIQLGTRSVVEIAAYTLQGRMVLALDRTMGPGPHSLGLPVLGSGIHLYRLTVGDEKYSFNGVLLRQAAPVSSLADAQTQSHPEGLEKPAGTATAIDDVIAVTKDGYLIYRVTVTNSDTSGIEIEMILSAGTVADADGNVYQTVRIGSQVWTVENLRTTKYSNGESIALEQHNTEWVNLASPAYCYYRNRTEPHTVARYGVLYNFYAVDTNTFIPGWHVPSDAEWDILQSYLTAHGYQLREDNRTGFSPVPAGYRHGLDGEFYDQGTADYSGNAWWWSSTEMPPSNAWIRLLHYDVDLFRSGSPKTGGLSVRLVEDE